MAARKSTFTFDLVEEPKSTRGRKSIPKPNMEALVASWAKFPVGGTIVLPDNGGSAAHADVALDRHHFKKVATSKGLLAGQDYTIMADKVKGVPVIKRLK